MENKVTKLASNLLNHSVKLQKGEKILLSGTLSKCNAILKKQELQINVSLLFVA